MTFPIYLDNHSTTRIDDRVLEAMLPYFQENYGNPSSRGHYFGWTADEAVENARGLVAEMINASPSEIIFTSGTTEANNFAIKGLCSVYGKTKNHLITTETEHPSVLEVFLDLKKKGFNVSVLPVDKCGLINPEMLKQAITEKTLLVSVMAANNEIGTISPIEEIAELCHEKNTFFHTDAAQAVGKINFNVKKINADLVSFSAHKNYGPKGIGALFIKKKLPSITLAPQILGGGQERNLRSGTLNVPAIVGFGKSMEISMRVLSEENNRIKNLRDKLQNIIFTRLEGVFLNGHPDKRLPNNLNLSFDGINVDLLLLELNDLAISTGSACASANPEPSHVLKAIGLNVSLQKSTVRFGLGRYNNEEEIDYAADKIVTAVNKLRSFNK